MISLKVIDPFGACASAMSKPVDGSHVLIFIRSRGSGQHTLVFGGGLACLPAQRSR